MSRQLSIDETASHAPADSNQSKTHKRILRLLDTYGPLCDTDIAFSLMRNSHGETTTSESGLRTRRSELAAKGYVEDSGLRSRLASGRHSIIWRLTEEGRRHV